MWDARVCNFQMEQKTSRKREGEERGNVEKEREADKRTVRRAGSKPFARERWNLSQQLTNDLHGKQASSARRRKKRKKERKKGDIFTVVWKGKKRERERNPSEGLRRPRSSEQSVLHSAPLSSWQERLKSTEGEKLAFVETGVLTSMTADQGQK